MFISENAKFLTKSITSPSQNILLPKTFVNTIQLFLLHVYVHILLIILYMKRLQVKLLTSYFHFSWVSFVKVVSMYV